MRIVKLWTNFIVVNVNVIVYVWASNSWRQMSCACVWCVYQTYLSFNRQFPIETTRDSIIHRFYFLVAEMTLFLFFNCHWPAISIFIIDSGSENSLSSNGERIERALLYFCFCVIVCLFFLYENCVGRVAAAPLWMCVCVLWCVDSVSLFISCDWFIRWVVCVAMHACLPWRPYVLVVRSGPHIGIQVHTHTPTTTATISLK